VETIRPVFLLNGSLAEQKAVAVILLIGLS
jgi:hypothetical protein